jgi:hypothetical protein
MDNFRRQIMLAVMILIIMLILFSIFGAFLGAQRAQAFFNSSLISVCWFGLLFLLAAGLFLYKKVKSSFGLLLIHLGCILVLAGAMVGSQLGHKIQKRLLGIDTVRRGQMVIGQSEETDQVLVSMDGPTVQLPFSIRLNEFKIQYYEPKILQVRTRQGSTWKIPIELNTDFDLGKEFGKVKIVRQFKNFRVILDDDARKVVDSNEPGYNPAVEVQIEYPDGRKMTRYVFEGSGGHSYPQDNFQLTYTGMVRDYTSDLAIIENNQIVAGKTIEVNHPLHYGGYYFYQQSYDTQDGIYSILEVVSDRGLSIVYSGYLLLGAGVFWHFWLRYLVRRPQHGN